MWGLLSGLSSSTCIVSWLHFGFLWSVPLLDELDRLVDVVLGHVHLWGPAGTDRLSGDNHPLDVGGGVGHQGRDLVPVEEGGEDEDDGGQGEPGGLANVTPA